MADDVQLPDLEVIGRYSLAVRAATAPREEVVAALEADLAWLTAERPASRRPRAARGAGAAAEPAQAAAPAAPAAPRRSRTPRAATEASAPPAPRRRRAARSQE